MSKSCFKCGSPTNTTVQLLSRDNTPICSDCFNYLEDCETLEQEISMLRIMELNTEKLSNSVIPDYLSNPNYLKPIFSKFIRVDESTFTDLIANKKIIINKHETDIWEFMIEDNDIVEVRAMSKTWSYLGLHKLAKIKILGLIDNRYNLELTMM